MSNHGEIWWNELNTWKPKEAIAYYSAVMGWTFEEVPTAGTEEQRPYYIAKKNEKPVAGIFTMHLPLFEGLPEHWFTYLAVDNIKSAIANSNAQGGRVRREPFDIPGFGILAIVADANGAVMGFLEPIGDS